MRRWCAKCVLESAMLSIQRTINRKVLPNTIPELLENDSNMCVVRSVLSAIARLSEGTINISIEDLQNIIRRRQKDMKRVYHARGFRGISDGEVIISLIKNLATHLFSDQSIPGFPIADNISIIQFFEHEWCTSLLPKLAQYRNTEILLLTKHHIVHVDIMEDGRIINLSDYGGEDPQASLDRDIEQGLITDMMLLTLQEESEFWDIPSLPPREL